MSKNSYKVIEIEENELFDSDSYNRIKSALILKYSNPIVSLPFLKDNITLEESEKIGRMVGISFNENGCVDKNGNLIDTNFMVITIVNELSLSAKSMIDKDDDSSYYLASLVKGIISKKVLTKLNKVENEIMSVDDLMAKLYGEKEEKGMVR